MSTFLVTGGSGCIGSRILHRLGAQGHTVYALQRSEFIRREPGVQYEYCDLTTISEARLCALFERVQPEVLIHCAALTNVDACEGLRELAYALNAAATYRLARVCGRYGVHCLFLSTDYVYDGTSPRPYLEEDQVRPLSVYGQSKLLGERAVQEVCESWTICRTAVVYGSVGGARQDFTLWLAQQLQRKQPVRIVCDQVSSPTYVEDLVEQILALASLRAQGIYHTAGSSMLDRYQFALLVARFLSANETLISPILSDELAQKAQRPTYAGLCIEKISRKIGVRPLSVEEGLTRCMTAIKEQSLLSAA
ncbi:dTDP-4-dehydrorhamnose reductase [Thermosporothrix hazakensis]|uniref:dTDP-4-dehydrorhamnose reductase n=1 Tax=Thermosporothrix hazakensis TaxID=644383 RepID=A0A326UC46_THEHA|nr:dTDP-4-dehydrorhamnose reductase [Thermosporothrix hazakensis]PZW22851.1 dTDP-4-dehydrorhamnose reductase [Thermosporothrix hazakensis]GCE49818.1 NAD(P)-dependent oxidoreductase [Thermosporothrix hazakensis]